MAFGIIGIEIFQTETQGQLALGEQLTLGRYVLTYDGLTQFDTPDNRNVARAVVSVYREGDYLGELYPRARLLLQFATVDDYPWCAVLTRG